MKTQLSSLFKSFVRFKTAFLLNVMGLTIAFASFLVIMMQVRHELTFDTCYPDADRIFQFDMKLEPGEKFFPYYSRPVCELIFQSSPGIEKGGFREIGMNKYTVYDPDQGAASAILYTRYSASEDYPDVFGFSMIEGSYDNFSLEKKALIPQDLAEKIFKDRSAIGQNLHISNQWMSDTYEIIGVFASFPKSSSQPHSIVTSIGNYNKDKWQMASYVPYLRLYDSARSDQVLDDIIQSYLTDFPQGEPWANKEYMHLTNLHDRYFLHDNSDHQKGNYAMVYSMIGIAWLILIVAMINFINFSLSLVPRRIQNINTRKILGSSVGALRFQLFFEAGCLSLISVGLALFVVNILSKSSFTHLLDADIGLRHNIGIVGWSMGIALITGVLAAIYPAVYSTSHTPAIVLKGSFGLSGKGRRLRQGLIGFQYFTSIGLIIVALFFSVQNNYMKKFDSGIDRKGLVTVRLTPDMLKSQDAIKQRLKENAGVIDVAYADEKINNFNFSKWGLKYEDQYIVPHYYSVSRNFLSVLGIEISEGRDFNAGDELKPGAYIFNQAAQREYQLEVNKVIQNYAGKQTAEIVGFAKDFNYQPLHYPIAPFAMYLKGSGDGWPLPVAYVKMTDISHKPTLDHIRTTLLDFDPNAQHLIHIETFDESLGMLYQKEDNTASLISIFSLIAVLISTVGALGMIMFEAEYRRKEIGLRKVFGATVNEIIALFNKRYIQIVMVCFVLAAPVAYYVNVQWRQNFTYKAPIGTWIFLVSLAMVLLITVTTITLQCYKTANDNPVNAIRGEG